MFNKEKVLEQSRNSNTDEGAEYFEIQGYKLGLRIFSILIIFIILFDIFFRNTFNHTAFALYNIVVGSSFIYKYKFTGKKYYLTIAILNIIASIESLIAFIIV